MTTKTIEEILEELLIDYDFDIKDKDEITFKRATKAITQAMLDIPEMQDEKEDLMDKWTPEMSAVITETRRIIYGRNALRAEIRTAIKLIGGSDE